MDADKTLIRLIDEEIARLEATKSEILGRVNGSHKVPTQAKREPKQIVVPLNGKTREGQLMEFLRANGPSSPKDILAGTGMPRGSLGFTITRATDKIERFEDGRYALKR